MSTKKRGFAALTPERRREIASAGGIARKKFFDQNAAEMMMQKRQRMNLMQVRPSVGMQGTGATVSAPAAASSS